MDAEQLEDMKSMITISRKRDLNFALCMGKKLEDMGILIHRIKTPELLLRKAKRLDGVMPAKYTLGTIRAKGRHLMFTCHAEPPPGALLKLRKFFIKIEMPMKIILLDEQGSVIDEDDDEKEEVVAAKKGKKDKKAEDAFDDLKRVGDGWTPEDGVNSATGKWRKARRLIGPRILAYAAGSTPDAAGIGQSWERALEMGDKRGNPAEAYRMMERIVGRIKAARTGAPVEEEPMDE